MTDLPRELAHAAPGVIGSLIALPFLRGTWPMRLSMVIGGCALSYFGTTPLAKYLGMVEAQGLVGFFIGLFGMALVGKVYEAVQAFNASAVGQIVIEAVRKRLGV